MAIELDSSRVIHDFDRGAFRIWAIDNGQEVRCFVTDEAIQDLTGESTFDPQFLRPALLTSIATFSQLIVAKYEDGRIESDGSVVVKSSDVA